MAKASAGVVSGLRGLSGSTTTWPDAREALMELYVVLDEWCEAAEETNAIVRRTLEGARPPVKRPNRLNPISRGTFTEPVRQVGSSRTFGGFVEVVTRDSAHVLGNQAHWSKRWRSSNRRQAARRSLRSMMRLYCPEVLESFEEAVAERAHWILEHRKHLPLALSDPDTPRSTVQDFSTALEETLEALRSARQSLANLIKHAYPLGPLPEST
ncbi:hypothetical protein ABZ921_09705 [Streptomyces atriruber]|uniref:Uncharacterized protein n=1 Tax=Streptomyces atriruber TaxID=545121 RepID=A0ABV3BIT6_9ACTN